MGGSGFGREDPPLDPPESVWDGRNPSPTTKSSGRTANGSGLVSLAEWVESSDLLDRPSFVHSEKGTHVLVYILFSISDTINRDMHTLILLQLMFKMSRWPSYILNF